MKETTSLKNQVPAYRLWAAILILPVFLLFHGRDATARAWTNAGLIALTQAMTVPTAEPAPAQAARAETLLRQSVAMDPDNDSNWRGLGFALLAQGREDEALTAWRNAGVPEDEFIQRGLANLYLENNAEAFVWFNRAAALNPAVDKRDTLYGLGRVYAGRSDWDGAIQTFEQALNAPAGQVGRSEIYYRLGHIQQLDLLSPDEKLAWQYYEQALALDEFGQAEWAKVETHYQRGRILSARRQWAEAAQEFQQAAALDPTHYWAHILAGSALWQAGENETAKAMMRRAIALKPDEWHAYQRLGRFYQLEGDVAQARAMYARALELDPQNRTVRKALQSLNNSN